MIHLFTLITFTIYTFTQLFLQQFLHIPILLPDVYVGHFCLVGDCSYQIILSINFKLQISRKALQSWYRGAHFLQIRVQFRTNIFTTTSLTWRNKGILVLHPCYRMIIKTIKVTCHYFVLKFRSYLGLKKKSLLLLLIIMARLLWIINNWLDSTMEI